MQVKFWGTRGSLPVAQNSVMLQGKLRRALKQASGRRFQTDEEVERFLSDELDFPTAHTFGGNSSCVQIDTGGKEYFLCDLGSGAREFGNHSLKHREGSESPIYHVLISHLHWDHIMGFPLFAPAYFAGHQIVIHGCHAELEEAFRRQHSAPGFPVPFDKLSADIRFNYLKPAETVEIAGCNVTPKLQLHSGDSYGYRIEKAGKAIVYSTDSEHKQDDIDIIQGFADFFRHADLVIFDAMYSLAETVSIKEDWGHSSNIVGVELCQMANAQHLCLFHHEPMYDDDTLYRILQETRRYEELSRSKNRRLLISSAYDGMEIAV